MISDQQLQALDPQVRQAMLALMAEVAAKSEQLERGRREVAHKQALIDKLTHENALLKRLKFAAQSEKFTAQQRSLLEETFDADLAEVGREMKRLGVDVDAADDKAGKKTPKRAALPPHLPRRDVHHEPESTVCGCGCQMQRICEEVAEKLDYQPGVFTVERHVRGKPVLSLSKGGRAGTARSSCRRPYPHTSSTRASRRPGCWPRCWWRSSSTTCRCTGTKRCSNALGT